MNTRTNGHPADPHSFQNLSLWIASWMRENLKLGDAEIDPDTTFVKVGMDSVHAMMLVGDLEDRLNRRLSPTLAWDYPTVKTLAEHLAGTPDGAGAAPGIARSNDVLDRLDELSEEEVDKLLEEHLEQRLKPGES